MVEILEMKFLSRFVQELVLWPYEVTLIKRTQPFGPLCLRQLSCFVCFSVCHINDHFHKRFVCLSVCLFITFYPHFLRRLYVCNKKIITSLKKVCLSVSLFVTCYHNNIKSELSAWGTKRNGETQKCTSPNCILARRSRLLGLAGRRSALALVN